MKKILFLLLTLLAIGILWIMSEYWRFSREEYVNSYYVQKSQVLLQGIDTEFLKKEFLPAYEF